MQKSLSRLALTLGVFALMAPSQAQQPLSMRGLTSTWPAGYFTDRDGFSNEIYLRSGGLANPIVTSWNGAVITVSSTMPNYGAVHELDPAIYGKGIPDLRIDAHSTANSNIPAFEVNNNVLTGVPSMSGEQWFGLSMSLGHRLNGMAGNSGSLFRFNAIEVVGYYFKESGSIPGHLKGRAVGEYKRNGFGLNGDSDSSLQALDYGMGFVSYEEPNLPPGMFNNTGDYYFSVDQAFVEAYPINGFAGGPNGSAPHAGTIYRRGWDSLNLKWGHPEEYIPFSQLHLKAGGNIDALAINDNDPENVSIIFSVTSTDSTTFTSGVPEVERSQLMVCMYDADADELVGPVALKDDDGSAPDKRVTEKVKIKDLGNADDDQVSSLCGIDPEPLPADPRAGMYGNTTDQQGPNDLGLSIARTWTAGPSGGSKVFVDVTGWGGMTPADGTVSLFRRELGLTGSWTWLGSAPRTAPTLTIYGAVPFNSFELSPTFVYPGTSYVYKAALILPNNNPVFSTPLLFRD